MQRQRELRSARAPRSMRPNNCACLDRVIRGRRDATSSPSSTCESKTLRRSGRFFLREAKSQFDTCGNTTRAKIRDRSRTGRDDRLRDITTSRACAKRGTPLRCRHALRFFFFWASRRRRQHRRPSAQTTPRARARFTCMAGHLLYERALSSATGALIRHRQADSAIFFLFFFFYFGTRRVPRF